MGQVYEMDFENEKLLKLIYPGGVPDHLQEDPELLPQILKLGSFKVNQIKKEEARLAEDNKSVVEHTQDLAISNYKTFIQTSQNAKRIYKEFKETEGQLNHLIDVLPNLHQKCEHFIETSSEIASSRRLNSLTLKRNVQLLEILELPQLMDSCIYQEKYEEALELAANVRRMGVKHSNIPVINNIVKSVESSWHTMLEQLLSQLQTDLQLPKCLQIIGYLRRMQAFSLPELRLKFLQGRDTWFNSILSAIPKDTEHLMKAIEASRVNLFNIVTQYKATFAEDESSLDPSDTEEHRSIFHAWMNTKINDFLITLEADLDRSDVTSFDTILKQCMYFGLSFSRVGVDFRALLIPIFVRAISKQFNATISKVTKQFETNMENYTFINKMSINVLNAIGRTNSTNNSPPETLLSFQPLAVYCNEISRILNDLRNCAPISLVNEVSSRIQGSLLIVSRKISQFYRQEHQALGAKERDIFVKFCCAYAFDLIPYIQRCIHEIFPINLLTSHFSINTIALQKSGISYLNRKAILEPLSYLLPDKSETVTDEVPQSTSNDGPTKSKGTDAIQGDEKTVSEANETTAKNSNENE